LFPYLSKAYINAKIERDRHTRDIAHPMYEIIDNVSSAAVGYGKSQLIILTTYNYITLTSVPRTLTSTAKLVKWVARQTTFMSSEFSSSTFTPSCDQPPS